MNIRDCHNFDDYRKLAKKKLPSPIFHYIDGGSDDEITLNRNTEAFNDCDLVPNVLSDVGNIDLSTIVFGKKIDFPLFLAPTAMHRLYHHHGEKASALAAEKFGTIFSMSTMSTTSIEEIGNFTGSPKLFQLYIHKDTGLTDNLIERCERAGFDAICLTVDTVVAGNRERDRKTGFTTPPRLTLSSLISFITHPVWSFNYLTHKKFKLANIIHMTEKGSSIDKSIIDYINEQFDPSMNWKDAEYCVKNRGNNAYSLKGWAQYILGNYEEAFSDFNECIRLNKTDSKCYNGKGNYYFNIKMNYQLALDAFSNAIRYNSKEGKYYFNRGLTNEKIGYLIAPCADYKKAVRFGFVQAESRTNWYCK